MPNQIRSTDPPEEAPEVIQERAPEGRGRTMAYSAFVAGIIAFAMTWGYDFEQRNRSLVNCERQQRIAKTLATVAGDVKKRSPEPTKSQWAAYEKTFREGFPPNGRSCEEVFPLVDIIPFF